MIFLLYGMFEYDDSVRIHFFRVPKPKHHQIFLPGYELHQCLQLTRTYNGLENLEGFKEEYMLTKIQAFKRICNKVGTLAKIVNDELYAMHIQSDSAAAWGLMIDVFRMSSILCKRYTNFDTNHPDREKLTDTTEVILEIKCMLRHLKYCSTYNPRDTISPLALNIMSRLLHGCATDMERYLKHIEKTHRNVQAE